MRAIELSGKEVIKLLNAIPEELKKELLSKIKGNEDDHTFKHLKRWINDVEHDCPVDNMFIKVCSDFINRTGKKVHEALKLPENSDGICSVQVGIFAINSLRKIANEIEEAIKDHNHGEECH